MKPQPALRYEGEMTEEQAKEELGDLLRPPAPPENPLPERPRMLRFEQSELTDFQERLRARRMAR